MWEGSYGKEPFDLRLTVLRLIRNLNKILVLTIVGTLLFGGIYYVKNVVLRPAKEYSVTSTYKVQYVSEPDKSGDYYINAATWETLVDTEEFLKGVQRHLKEVATEENITVPEYTVAELVTMVSAKLPSDWHIPTTTVVTNDPTQSKLLAKAVEQTMTNELPEIMQKELASVTVLDSGNAEEVLLDVRPVRAFVLSAVLSFFFILVFFLLKELGDDSIWLPSTIRRRYGLPVLGTLHSAEFAENVKYLFGEKKKVAVCSVDAEVNPEDVLNALREKLWTAMPAPILCPESCEKLREADGILLVVKAGAHAGKRLEYVLEMLRQQDCKVTAAILWEADETLIKAYYCLPADTDNE